VVNGNVYSKYCHTKYALSALLNFRKTWMNRGFLIILSKIMFMRFSFDPLWGILWRTIKLITIFGIMYQQ